MKAEVPSKKRARGAAAEAAPRVAILGGGAVGVTLLRELSRAGVEVVLAWNRARFLDAAEVDDQQLF